VSGEPLFPLFLRLAGRPALVVGGGQVAAARVRQLLDAGARVAVVAPDVRAEILASGAAVERRPFEPRDLQGVWLAVAAATPEVNRAVAAAAEARRVFVVADDPASGSAWSDPEAIAIPPPRGPGDAPPVPPRRAPGAARGSESGPDAARVEPWTTASSAASSPEG
jgi:hypothetical protein